MLFQGHMTSGDLSCTGGIDSVADCSDHQLLFSTTDVQDAVCKLGPSVLDHVSVLHEAFLVMNIPT